jgi:hypothetical protein
MKCLCSDQQKAQQQSVVCKINIMQVLMFVYRETSHGKFSNVLDKVEPLLSGIRWDNQGNVIGAKATILNWILKKVS